MVKTGRRFTFLLLVGLLLFGGAGGGFFMEKVFAAGASRLRCDICRQTIQGRYFQSGTRDICMNCYSRYPKCAVCGIPVRDGGSRAQGRAVCRDCRARVGECDNCGEALVGEFIKANKGFSRFCKRCFTQKPKCARCGLPHKGLFKAGNDLICRSCVQQADKCSACSLPIIDKYYQIQFVPGRYCKTCFEQRPHCDICGRPIVAGGQTYPDGRRSCSVCNATAVTTMEEAQKLLASTVRFLRSELGMHSNVPFDFALVDNGQMAKLHDRKPDKSVKELGLYGSRLTPLSVRPTIAIIMGLPRAAFLETVAHEYAHHWQVQKNPKLEELSTIEGFAQWVAAQWLVKNKIYSGYAKLEANPDPVYGEGYRKIKKYAEQNGIPALMQNILLVKGQNLKPAAPQAMVAMPAAPAIPVGQIAAQPQGVQSTSSVNTPAVPVVPTPVAINPGLYQGVVFVNPAGL